jgi:hypothetical protein
MKRTATIRSTVPEASTVGAAIEPDNTDQMTTSVEDGTIITTIERETTAGLRSTVDDYVVNLGVALAVARTTNRQTTDDDTAHS